MSLKQNKVKAIFHLKNLDMPEVVLRDQDNLHLFSSAALDVRCFSEACENQGKKKGISKASL